MLISAHTARNNPDHTKHKGTQLAADPPAEMLHWISKFTKAKKQHMANPLSLHPELFPEPASLMPGTTTRENPQHWIPKEEQLSDLWEITPWTQHGIFAMTSGPANSHPDPYAQTLARAAIRKATVSAQIGVTTILLLELQGKVDRFPDAITHNRKIQMHKLVTIPAGRLAQWKGSSSWTTNITKGTLS